MHGKYKSKKAQITVFIIIGIVMLMVFFLIIMLLSRFEVIGSGNSNANMQDYIERCVEYVGGYGMYKLGIQGGTINLPNGYYNKENINVAYAYNNGKTLTGIPDMENQLNIYITQNLDFCINEYIIENRLNEDIDIGAPSVKTTFASKDVLFEVGLPITTKIGDSVTRSDETYNVKLPIQIKMIHAIVDDIVNKKVTDPEEIYLDCIYEPTDITVDKSGDTTLFLIQDNSSTLFNEPYKFLFAVK